jgi:hypothetical protein
VDILLKAGFPHHKTRLTQPLVDKIFQKIGLKPFNKGLVAYHTGEKQAIGFLQLVNHSKWLYSIKFVYTNPKFRKIGVATGLFNFAASITKRQGGRKLFLNVYPTDTSVIGLYNKLGFKLISNNFEVWAQGRIPKSPLQHKSQLLAFNLDSKKSKIRLFNLCQRCMSDDWVNFFEINGDNLINGFSGDFQHFFLRNAFINDSNNSFILVFKRVISKFAFAELYTALDSEVPSMIDGLFRILQDQGIEYIFMKLFNIASDSCIEFIKKRGFYKYHSICMGKYL